jgi:predicted transcriptional regulator
MARVYPDGVNESLRAMLESYVRAKHGGSQSAAARVLEIAQPVLSDLLTGKKGFGPKTLHALAQVDARAWAVVQAMTPAAAPAPSEATQVERTPRYPEAVEAANALVSVDGWSPAEAQRYVGQIVAFDERDGSSALHLYLSAKAIRADEKAARSGGTSLGVQPPPDDV